MNSRIYISLLLLVLTPIVVICLTTIRGPKQEVILSESNTPKIKVEIIKAELPLNVEESPENKIQVELLSQNIKAQKCTADSWCDFIPNKKNRFHPFYCILHE